MKRFYRPICLMMAGVMLYTSVTLDVYAAIRLNVGMPALMDLLEEKTSTDEAVHVINSVLNPTLETYGYKNLGIAKCFVNDNEGNADNTDYSTHYE